jgi:ribosome-associated heat shock protein Hsp15
MDSEQITKVRIDKYLWAIRLFKTRSLSASACNEGKVKIDEESPVKASKVVKPGEIYSIRKEGKRTVIKVITLIENRVNASIATTCYADITPEEEKEKQQMISAFYFPAGKRGNKQSRPTKKDRRKLTEMRGDI